MGIQDVDREGDYPVVNGRGGQLPEKRELDNGATAVGVDPSGMPK
jgi:hypothetical protein